jgi:hypothetical protein
MHEYTPEQTADFQERAKAFSTDYEKLYTDLSAKHEVELQFAPITVPTPNGFTLSVTQNIGDLKYKAIESPITPEMLENKDDKPVIE